MIKCTHELMLQHAVAKPYALSHPPKAMLAPTSNPCATMGVLVYRSLVHCSMSTTPIAPACGHVVTVRHGSQCPLCGRHHHGAFPAAMLRTTHHIQAANHPRTNKVGACQHKLQSTSSHCRPLPSDHAQWQKPICTSKQLPLNAACNVDWGLHAPHMTAGPQPLLRCGPKVS